MREVQKTLCLVLCLLALALADDANVSCPLPDTVTLPASCTTATTMDLDEYTSISLDGGSPVCFAVSYGSDDVQAGQIFVLAVRPGDDAAGNYTYATNTAYNYAATPVACAQIQPFQEEDDADYVCDSDMNDFTGASVLYVEAAVDIGPVSYQMYVGFSEGSVCSSDLVSAAEGSSIWLWVVIALAAVLLCLCATCCCVAGCVILGGLVYKSNKSNASLYEAA